MRKGLFVTAVTAMLVFGNITRGTISVLVNGSFEDDGPISDITEAEPNGWDVNIPDAGKFAGSVDDYWVAGANCLELYSVAWATFEANDMATVSQEVYLKDVNQIIFDLKLRTYAYTAWNASKITPVLLIDNEVVWDMSGGGSDIRGEYFDVIYDVNEIYQDEQPHQLSFGLRVTVSEQLQDYYESYWDYMEFNIYCDDCGLIWGDLNRDCYVDANDLRMFTQVWLKEAGEKSKYNLYRGDDDANGIVNSSDYSILADNWGRSSYD